MAQNSQTLLYINNSELLLLQLRESLSFLSRSQYHHRCRGIQYIKSKMKFEIGLNIKASEN